MQVRIGQPLQLLRLEILFLRLNYGGMDDKRNTKIHSGLSRLGAVVSDLLLDRGLLGVDL